jgi:NAD(P)-dependent dehydrogenase (short-subunit alcohol dehydrogenase family)
MQIKFQTALITGSSRGLGRQIAVKLATEGVKKIAIHYRTGRSDSETTLSLIEAAGASGVLVQGDVADPLASENLVKEAAQKLGGCDIFIQSVCPPLGEIYEHVMATDLSLEKWQLAFDTQARAFSWCPDSGEVYARRGTDYRDVLFTERTNGWLATLGGNGIGEGSDGQYQPVFRGCAGPVWNYGEHGQSGYVGCGGHGTDSARVSGCGERMGGIRMDAYATTGHGRGYCGRLCASLQ